MNEQYRCPECYSIEDDQYTCNSCWGEKVVNAEVAQSIAGDDYVFYRIEEESDDY